MKTPEGWLAPAVGEIFEILGGGTPSTAMPQYWQGDIPWITSADIHGLRDVRPRKYVTREGIADSAANTAPPGSVIVVTRVALGKVALVERELSYSQDSQALVPKSGDVDSLFASYALSSATQVFKTDNRGTTIKGVTKKELRDLPLLLPPLPEQKKIAEILGSVDESIRATKAVIEQTKKVKKGLLQQLLTRGIGHTRFKQTEIGEIPESWEVVRLGDIMPTSEGIKPGPFGSALIKSRYVADGFKVYGQEQVLAGDLSFGDYYINREHFLELEKFAVRSGDLLLTLVGAGTPGKVLIVQPPFAPGVINPRLIRIRTPSAMLTPHFLAKVFEAPFTQTEIVRIGQGGAMPVLSASLVRSLQTPLPPLAEQHLLVEYLDEWNVAIDRSNAELACLLQQRTGLMQDLLTGKVRVTV